MIDSLISWTHFQLAYPMLLHYLAVWGSPSKGILGNFAIDEGRHGVLIAHDALRGSSHHFCLYLFSPWRSRHHWNGVDITSNDLLLQTHLWGRFGSTHFVVKSPFFPMGSRRISCIIISRVPVSASKQQLHVNLAASRDNWSPRSSRSTDWRTFSLI